METLLFGAAAIACGGLLNGTFAYPMKLVRCWKWENIWLLFGLFGLVLFPAAVAFWSIEGLWGVYESLPAAKIAATLGLGTAWGCGSLLFGLGISALGFSLGYAIVMGTTAVLGTIVPALVLNPSMLLTARGAALLGSIGLILAGLAQCTIAGWLRDANASGDTAKANYRILNRMHFRKGLALCLASGLLSACFNIGFALAGDIIAAAQRAGASPVYAGFSAWALIMPAGVVPSVIYCGYLLSKNKSVGNYLVEQRNWLFALLMAGLWVFAIGLYGAGTHYLGPRGTTVGWPVMTSSAILGANVLGIAAGEWRSVPAIIRRYLYAGLGCLIGAVILAGTAGVT